MSPRRTRRALLVSHSNARDIADWLCDDFPEVSLTVVEKEEEADFDRGQVEILMTFGVGLTTARVEQMPRLRWVQALVSGADNIALALAGSDPILTTCSGVHGPQIAEATITHMLVLARDILGFADDQRQRRWNHARGTNAPLLAGKSVAIVGLGTIGRALAPLCKAFGMNVTGVSNAVRDADGVDRYVDRDRLLEIVADTDFLVLAVPQTAETVGIVDAELLQAINPGAFLVNVGRGGLVDESALIAALRSGSLAGAGLDVQAEEPLPPESPLWSAPNVFITPHIAGSSDEYPRQIYPIVRRNMELYLAGSMEQMVNRAELH